MGLLKKPPLWQYDFVYWQRYAGICGVDEAGRGPIAGPLVAAAAFFRDLPRDCPVDDSKILSPKKRETLYVEIIRLAAGIGIGIVAVEEMNSLSMHQATFLAMRRALRALPEKPPLVLIDGKWGIPGRHAFVQEAIVDGDALSGAIAAASILAKVTRDRMMMTLDHAYPDYGFSRHKGYFTPEHRRALARLGPCPAHRSNFQPVRACISFGLFAEANRLDR